MSKMKVILINKLDNENLLLLIDRGILGNSRDLISSILDSIATRSNPEHLIKSAAAHYTKSTLVKLYPRFSLELWMFYIRYHIYYIMPEHVRVMPEPAQNL